MHAGGDPAFSANMNTQSHLPKQNAYVHRYFKAAKSTGPKTVHKTHCLHNREGHVECQKGQPKETNRQMGSPALGIVSNAYVC